MDYKVVLTQVPVLFSIKLLSNIKRNGFVPEFLWRIQNEKKKITPNCIFRELKYFEKGWS